MMNSMLRFNRKPIKVLSVILFFLYGITSGIAQSDGAALFKSNCAACHAVSAKKGVGPGLEGFWDRMPGSDDEQKKSWYLSWVKDPAGMKASGDAYAAKITSEYPSLMTQQAHLSDADLVAIADYIKSKPHLTADAGASAVKGENPFTAPPAETDNSSTILWMLLVLVVLLYAISVIMGIRKNLNNLEREKVGHPPAPARGLLGEFHYWMMNHKLQTAIVILVLILAGAVQGFFALMDIGVYEGYAPEQPIKFSHKIHAGDNGINCLYCHHSAEKGKTAGIPSVNVCMNCHKAVEEGTWTKKEEISKIYEAAGWNPTEQKYDKPEKPIKWIRVHALPDFAYFNHSQHVVAGKQQCQTCHGQVEEMHLLKQHSDLTMGWCINCHRETNVAMEGNEYYAKLHGELKEKYQGQTTFSVEHIGGLECAKCHY